MPTIGANHYDTIGVTIPSHISSNMPASASTVVAAAQSNASFGAQSNQSLWTFYALNNRNYPYGMPPSFIVGHHTNPSTYSENLNVMRPQFYYPGASVPIALRHQLEDFNHEIVNMLAQQIGTVFNPLIRETHNSYLTLSDQMGRIADFFGAPPEPNTPTIHNENPRHIEGPNLVSALFEYVLMEELPRDWKVPKFTKFGGETSESTVEHIARSLTEADDIANNENMRMKYFPSSLQKMHSLGLQHNPQVAYVDTNNNNREFDIHWGVVEESEINVVELKPGPPYTCHNTSCCAIFTDSVQITLDEGRLKFGDKSKQPMHVDVDALKKADSMYVDTTGVNMVEISEIEPVVATESPKVDVEMATESHNCADEMVTEGKYAEKIKVVFPKLEEDLTDFLNR
ncbi:hypothetical protein MTR_3g040260 [Medicago truncatula]|uniref:Uncharacterized protein n=1 Tax=Medicago truncatula TaxID=3880 RepID=A0A072UUH1_MEDTR|nr:hypothetical protein MTR_3g040260 [Medicago truncatula]